MKLRAWPIFAVTLALGSCTSPALPPDADREDRMDAPMEAVPDVGTDARVAEDAPLAPGDDVAIDIDAFSDCPPAVFGATRFDESCFQ